MPKIVMDWKNVVIILLSFVCVAVAWKDAAEKTLSITAGGLSMQLEAKGQEIAHEELLAQMYESDFVRAGLIKWLAHKDIFHISDPGLAEALNKNLCGSIPAGPLPDRMRAARECAEKEVVRNLRQIARRKEVPFHYVGKEVEIGIPSESEHQPRAGGANTCEEDDDLAGKRVELTNPLNQKKLEVQASGYYPCSGVGRTPDVQLNPADARKLVDGPLKKYQSAIAVALN